MIYRRPRNDPRSYLTCTDTTEPNEPLRLPRIVLARASVSYVDYVQPRQYMKGYFKRRSKSWYTSWYFSGFTTAPTRMILTGVWHQQQSALLVPAHRPGCGSPEDYRKKQQLPISIGMSCTRSCFTRDTRCSFTFRVMVRPLPSGASRIH